jgi:hypothetical protein
MRAVVDDCVEAVIAGAVIEAIITGGVISIFKMAAQLRL